MRGRAGIHTQPNVPFTQGVRTLCVSDKRAILGRAGPLCYEVAGLKPGQWMLPPTGSSDLENLSSVLPFCPLLDDHCKPAPTDPGAIVECHGAAGGGVRFPGAGLAQAAEASAHAGRCCSHPV